MYIFFSSILLRVSTFSTLIKLFNSLECSSSDLKIFTHDVSDVTVFPGFNTLRPINICLKTDHNWNGYGMIKSRQSLVSFLWIFKTNIRVSLSLMREQSLPKSIEHISSFSFTTHVLRGGWIPTLHLKFFGSFFWGLTWQNDESKERGHPQSWYLWPCAFLSLICHTVPLKNGLNDISCISLELTVLMAILRR